MSRWFRSPLRLAIVAAATALGLAALYVLVSAQLAGTASRSPKLPTSGIVATSGDGDAMVGGDDVLVGRLRLADRCVSVVPDGEAPVIPVFGAGAASVDSHLSKLQWEGETFAEGDRVELPGEVVGPISALPSFREGYYLPSGCLDGNTFFVVSDLPD